MANPFLDPNDGHVLADDMEKNREAKEYGHAPTSQANPFLKPGVPIMSPGLRFTQSITGQTIGPIFVTDLAAGGMVEISNAPVVTVNLASAESLIT